MTKMLLTDIELSRLPSVYFLKKINYKIVPLSILSLTVTDRFFVLVEPLIWLGAGKSIIDLNS